MNVGPGTLIGGKYRIEAPVSRGGMGAVWAARHLELDQPVAIKVMDPELAASQDFRGRFSREARMVARLESPHVVQVKDYGIHDDVPYLVMELLRGEDLARRLRRLRRIDLPQAARIAAQAAKALRRAHEAGLVHRDLKPSNLFLARVDDEEVLKILDFGIVKITTGAVPGEMTRTGELLGSPYYMSPEQARGDRDLDGRSDLWSLGVILFQMTTGALPFQGDNLGVVLSRILVDPIPRATAIAADLPATLDAFFARALSRDRAARFQSAHELAHTFAAAAGVVDRFSMPPGPATSTGFAGPLASLRSTEPFPSSPSLAPPASGGTPAGMAGPAQPGTLTSATTGEVAASRRGRAARWALGLGALAAIAGGALVLTLGGGAGGTSPGPASAGDSTSAPAAAAPRPPAAPSEAAPAAPAVPAETPASTVSAVAPAAAATLNAAPTAPAALTPRPQASAWRPAPNPYAAPSAAPSPNPYAAPSAAPSANKSGDLRDPWADK